MKKSNLLKLLIVIFLTINFKSVSAAEIIPVSFGKSAKNLPASEKSLTGDNQDGILICWLDEANNGSLFLQKIDNSGNHVWNGNGLMIEKELGSGFTASSDYPAIYSDNAGGAIIIYRKVLPEADEIYFSKISADGNISDAVCLSSNIEGSNFSPSSVYTMDNCIAVTWENFSDGNFNINAQKIDLEGNKLWNYGKEIIVCNEPGDERQPTIICNERNELIITWLDSRNSDQGNEFGLDLYANKFDANGINMIFPVSGKCILNFSKTILKQYTDSNFEDLRFRKGKGPNKTEKVSMYNHNLVLSDNNSVIIASDIWRLDEDSFLKVFKINENLDVVWENIIQENSFQFNPLIISDGNFGACVFWNDSRNDENRIYGNRFNRNGISSSGDSNGIMISLDESKNHYRKELAYKYNKNGIYFEENKLCLPWVTLGTDNFYLSTFDMNNSNPFKFTSEVISNDVITGECVSVNFLNNEAVSVFLKDKRVFISMNVVNKKPDQSFSGKIYLSNFPNPFNPVTKIRYQISDDIKGSSNVSLKVYDLTGKEVATLVNENMISGIYETTFNGNNLPSGTFFIKISVGEYSQVRKIILLK